MKISGPKSYFDDLSQEGKSPKDRLLESAGILFAAKGFRDVSVREIAAHAGVNSALVGYYFRGKQALFNEVYRLHAAPLAVERMKRLAAISGKKRKPTVAEILKAWLVPWLQLEELERNFLRVHFMADLSAERWENMERNSSFNARMHNAFFKALRKSLPHLSKETVIWRLHFLVGSIVFGIRFPGSLKAISKGRCNSQDLEAVFNQIMPYAVAGFLAPEAQGESLGEKLNPKENEKSAIANNE
jgi:AcrR family transcriptional regulator